MSVTFEPRQLKEVLVLLRDAVQTNGAFDYLDRVDQILMRLAPTDVASGQDYVQTCREFELLESDLRATPTGAACLLDLATRLADKARAGFETMTKMINDRVEAAGGYSKLSVEDREELKRLFIELQQTKKKLES